MDDPEQLVVVLYDEIRVIARELMQRERAGHTLQTTALVHEAYLKLRGEDADERESRSRGYFMAAAARAMRRILVDHARTKSAAKRGHGAVATPITADIQPPDEVLDPSEMIALDDALERLEAKDKAASEVVHLRYFAGLSIDEVAEALGTSPSTVKRDWQVARAWIAREMQNS